MRRIHGVLRRALAQGVKWGKLASNPAVNASPPRVPAPELSPPAPAEVARLFELAAAEDPPLAVLLALAASTGARRGELVALRWSDVDLDARGRLPHSSLDPSLQSRSKTKRPRGWKR